MPRDDGGKTTSRGIQRDPLDDFLTDEELLAEARGLRRNPANESVADEVLRDEAEIRSGFDGSRSKVLGTDAEPNAARLNPLASTSTVVCPNLASVESQLKKIDRATTGRSQGHRKSALFVLLLVTAAVCALVGRQGLITWPQQGFINRTPTLPPSSIPAGIDQPVVATPPVKLSPQELFDKSSPAVVRVNVFDQRSRLTGQGTGFFVRDSETVLTNLHMIDGATSAQVVLKDGTLINVERVEGVDEPFDVAILNVARPPIRVRPLAFGPTALPSIGERVYVIGSPEGYDFTLSDGLVSGHHERNGTRWIQMTAPVSHGSSGSPVLNDQGAILGMATWVDWGGQNLNFATTCNAITSLVEPVPNFQSLADLISEKRKRIVELRRELGAKGAVQLAPKLDSLPKSFRRIPEFWLLKGDVLNDVLYIALKKNEIESVQDALAAYQQALVLDAGKSQTWARIGSTHRLLAWVYQRHNLDEGEMRRHEAEAMKAYQKGTEVNPNDEDCWGGLGKSLLSAARPKEAAVALRRCLAINPSKDGTHGGLAEALGALGDVEGAIAEYTIEADLASERSGGLWEVWDIKARPSYALGLFLQKHGRHTEAIAAFETALKLLPKDGKDPMWESCEQGIAKSRRIESLKKSN